MDLKAVVSTKGTIFEGKAPETIRGPLLGAMYEAVAYLERKVRENTPRGVGGVKGGLLATIHGEVEEKGAPVIKGVVGHKSKYGEVIEKGRTAGKTMPPKGYLLQWIMFKMQIPMTEARRIEFIVRRSIGRKGFPGAEMFAATWDSEWPHVEGIFQRAGFTITRALNE